MLRKFNLADRSRDQIGGYINVLPTPELTIHLSVEKAKDEYANSVYGLKNGEERSYTLAADYQMTQMFTLSAFVNNIDVISKQNGSDIQGDWLAESKDSVLYNGFDLSYRTADKEFELGSGIIHTDSRGKITINRGNVGFSDFLTERYRFVLYVNKLLDSGVKVGMSYVKERVDISDWTTTDPDTSPSILTTGEIAPTYNLDIISANISYKF